MTQTAGRTFASDLESTFAKSASFGASCITIVHQQVKSSASTSNDLHRLVKPITGAQRKLPRKKLLPNGGTTAPHVVQEQTFPVVRFNCRSFVN